MEYERLGIDEMTIQVILIPHQPRFLGYVNSIGTAFEAPTLATGLGSYIAQPLLREAYEKNSSMSRDEAREVIEKCLKVLFYRDCRALNKVTATVLPSLSYSNRCV